MKPNFLNLSDLFLSKEEDQEKVCGMIYFFYLKFYFELF